MSTAGKAALVLLADGRIHLSYEVVLLSLCPKVLLPGTVVGLQIHDISKPFRGWC